MFVANVGDSRVVLAHDDGEGLKAVPLTVDHKPDDPAEVERIKSLGGQIGRSNGIFRVAWNRVSQLGRHRGPVLRSTKMESVPFLAIARSLGKQSLLFLLLLLISFIFICVTFYFIYYFYYPHPICYM